MANELHRNLSRNLAALHLTYRTAAQIVRDERWHVRGSAAASHPLRSIHLCREEPTYNPAVSSRGMNRARRERSVEAMVHEAEDWVNAHDCPPALVELLATVREQVLTATQLVSYTQHRIGCDITIEGLVTERDDEGRPVVVRSRLPDDPAATCTCGLSPLVARLVRGR